MVQTADKNLKIVKRFNKKLKKSYDIELFILFGSRARGNFSQDSDFDIIVVSKDFIKYPAYKRSTNAYLEWTEDYPLEIFCYTPEEFEKIKKKSRVIREAIKEGIEIK
ncbi:nucleotidyltransferase domain-containing protein [Candidatus Pacearchaeota archaeon]|nr:nucleotidyltransferase domain-containing protein [Candidatus Pacearchaeota archaeon]